MEEKANQIKSLKDKNLNDIVSETKQLNNIIAKSVITAKKGR